MSHIRQIVGGLVFSLISAGSLWAGEAVSKVYVRSPVAKILESSRMDAKPIGSASKGSELAVLAHQGSWYQVKNAEGKQGWIMGAFVQNEPISADAQALAAAEANDPRNVRRRGPRAASMGVRGLSAGAGKLSAKDADLKALEKVEKQNVDPKKVEAYRRELSSDH